jgi:hypothetical protein
MINDFCLPPGRPLIIIIIIIPPMHKPAGRGGGGALPSKIQPKVGYALHHNTPFLWQVATSTAKLLMR